MDGGRLPVPAPGREAAERFVADHLADLVADPRAIAGSERFRGGQTAADAALDFALGSTDEGWRTTQFALGLVFLHRG